MDNNQSIFTTSNNNPLATLFFMMGALHIYGKIRRQTIRSKFALNWARNSKIVILTVFAIGIIKIVS